MLHIRFTSKINRLHRLPGRNRIPINLNPTLRNRRQLNQSLTIPNLKPQNLQLMTPILPLKKQHMMHPRLILRHPNLNNRLTGLFQIKRRLHLIQNTPQIILPVLIKILHMNPQHLP